jgi:hypothetical protein
MRLDEDDKKGQYVICENHLFSHETHWVNVKHGNKSWSQRCKLTLPENVGPKSSANKSEQSCGFGSDRELKRVLDESRKIIERGLISECHEDDYRTMLIRKARSS